MTFISIYYGILHLAINVSALHLHCNLLRQRHSYTYHDQYLGMIID